MDSRIMPDGNRIEAKLKLTQWHCLFCQKRLRSLDKRRHHEEENHPTQMTFLEIQYVWQRRARMRDLIDEHFALGEEFEKASQYVQPLIKERMDHIGREYRMASGSDGQHPLDHMGVWMKRLQDRLSELIA